MTFDDLFKKRRTAQTKSLIKYSRYIVNDHFVLLLLLIIGAGGFAYRNYLETVTASMIMPKLFLVILFFLVIISGKITLLVKEADKIFLLPKTTEFRTIFNQQLFYSFGKAILTIGLVTWLSSPLLFQLLRLTLFEVLATFLAFLSLKWLNLLVQIFPFFSTNKRNYQKYKRSIMLFTLMSVFLLIFVQKLLITAVLIILFIGTMYLFLSGKIYNKQTLKWEKMIEVEEKRLQNIYRFIQLFTDVPLLKIRIQRLKWLDPLVERISKGTEDVIEYYLIRLLLRNTTYSSLLIRLTLIGSFLLIYTESIGLSLLLISLFIYMAGFQLLSLVYDLDKVLPFHFYPINKQQKEKAVISIIQKILFLMASILALSSFYALGAKGLLLYPVSILFVIILTKFYFTKRIDKGKV